MKNFCLIQIAFLFAVFILAACSGHDDQLTIANPIDTARTDELIVLKRPDIESKIGTIPAGKFVLIAGNQPVLVQYDDMNGDGNWDELAFLYSFRAKEEVKFHLSVADAPATVKAVARAHARHKRKTPDDMFGDDLKADSIPAGQPATDFAKQPLPPFLTEGPSWENDKLGFRLYFDNRNGIDIWGKLTTAMVLDDIGTDTTKNYHVLSDWGMDILKVGQSLGAGSLAMQLPLGNAKDTLVKLAGINMGPVYYQKVADGPVRAIIRLHYPNWKVLDNFSPLSLTNEISIWGGQYFYESKVSIKGAPAGAKLVAGIVNLYDSAPVEYVRYDQKLLFTFGKQSENKDELGMAILTDKNTTEKDILSLRSNDDVPDTYAMRLKIENDKPIVFRFYAGWAKSDRAFETAEGFARFLLQQASFVQYKIKMNGNSSE